MRRLTQLANVFLILTVLLAACGSQPEPQAIPSTSPPHVVEVVEEVAVETEGEPIVERVVAEEEGIAVAEEAATAVPVMATPTPTQVSLAQLRFLTQNTQLLPGDLPRIAGQCKAKEMRVPCIVDLAGGYDIVALQEVFESSLQDAIVRAWHLDHGLSASLDLDRPILSEYAQDITDQPPSRNKQIEIIDARPNAKQVEIAYDQHFVLGPDDSATYSGGLLTLTKEGYPIVAVSAFVFTKSVLDIVDDVWDAKSNKGAIYARVQAGSGYIHVFNTHLQAHECSECSTARKHQLGELHEFIKKLTQDDRHPVVVLGDFNIDAASDEYDQLQSTLLIPLNLDDAWTQLRIEQDGTTWIGADQHPGKNSPWGDLGNQLAGENGKGQRLDYILYCPGINPSLDAGVVVRVPQGPPQQLYCFDDYPDTLYTFGKEYVGTIQSDQPLVVGGSMLLTDHAQDNLRNLGILLGETPSIVEKVDGAWTWWLVTGMETAIIVSHTDGLHVYRQVCNEIYDDGNRYVDAARYTIFDKVFHIPSGPEAVLDSGTIPDELRQGFEQAGIPLSEDATIEVVQEGKWAIRDGKHIYVVHRQDSLLHVFSDNRCVFRNHTVSDHLGLAMLP